MRVIAGRDLQDVTSLSAPLDDYEAALARGVAGVRIGWDDAYATSNVQPYVAAAMRSAISQLDNAGAQIIDVKVPGFEADELAAWNTLAAAEAAAVHALTFPAKQDEYGVYFREFLEAGRQTSAIDLANAIFARKRACGRIAPVFDTIDCLLSPTLASESFRYNIEDAYGGINMTKGNLAGVPLDFLARNTPFIVIWDFNGYPTLSLPCGFSPDGIPLSLQLVAAPLQESILCRVGHAFEQANDFHLQHPELF
jgi:amidase